jgi:hypothetical protein
LVVKNQLARMFEHRREVLEEKFGKVTRSPQQTEGR